MLNTVSAKLTGTPGASGWAQVHEFTPEEPEKLAARGHLVAAIATKRVEEGVDTITAGRELISRLHEEYFGELETKPFNALKNAVEKVISEFRESWGDIEVAAAAIVGDVVYSAAGGGSKVMVSRGGALGTILESGSEGVISASGYPASGDVMLLATKSFFEKISPGVLRAALSGEDLDKVVENLAPTVHSSPDSGNLGAAIIKFEKGAEIVSPMPVTASVSAPKLNFGFTHGLINSVGKFLKNLPQRGIYVKPTFSEEVTPQSKKLSFTVAIALLVILVVSIGFGIRQRRVNDLKNKYQGILVSASSEVDEAISLASVGPDRSRELFTDSEQKLAQIESLKVKDPKIDALRKKIEDSRASVLGEYEIAPELFLDLTLLSSGFKGDTISASGGQVYILDKNGKRIVSVAIDTKKSKVVAGPGLIDTAFDIASYEDRVFILGSDGIYEIGTDKTKVIDKTWSSDALIKAFAGNIYVLDKAGRQIYRYQGSGNTFEDKQNWLAAGTDTDFSGATSWKIDGSVYVLFPNAKILKFSLGSPQNFSVSGAIPEIGSIDDLYADGDNADIYFLDRAGKRVVVTDKNGKYIAQYIDDQISGATGLVVSEAAKKIILLTGDKLLSIDIKHLQ